MVKGGGEGRRFGWGVLVGLASDDDVSVFISLTLPRDSLSLFSVGLHLICIIISSCLPVLEVLKPTSINDSLQLFAFPCTHN
jgi:hypothetical protein